MPSLWLRSKTSSSANVPGQSAPRIGGTLCTDILRGINHTHKVQRDVQIS